LVVISNLSQQRRREQEAYESRKMELVGQVAGGVAHHFNNLLTVIENHAALLREKTQDAEMIEQLEQISVAAARGSNLTSQLLASSARQLIQSKPVDLNRLIGNLNLILRRIAGEKVVFQNNCAANGMPVLADPQVLENMLINLVKNARDAMPTGGTLTLSTAVVRVENPPVNPTGKGNAAEFVRMSVRDTGSGFTADAREHLFEPFFTTKEIGKGIGLGLASLYGAVRQHGGWVEVNNPAGHGAEIQIFLPCATQTTVSVREESQSASLNRGTVLLVEPEDRARGVARYILNRHGFHVIEADCASIAMVLWDGQARNIDLLFTDLRLSGGLSGTDLAGKLRQSRPDLKVIYACDSSPDKAAQSLTLSEGMKLVSKPYRPEQLLQSVEEFLGTQA
jgi:nitrogen-specific signal transduction histidine kinase/CheY-like chemotaxis protein